MVEFNGIIASSTKYRIEKNRMRPVAWILLIFIVFNIIFISISWPINSEDETIILVFTIILFIIDILIFIWPFKFNTAEWLVNVKIESNFIEYSPPLSVELRTIPLEKIKKVIDEGDCYHIIYAEYSNSIICQKDLLVQGTLEEFEEIFKDKLVRKIKVKSDKTK